MQKLTYGELAAIERALAGYITTLGALEGNLTDEALANDADSASKTIRGLRTAAGMGMSPVVEIQAQ